jgi:hypothetical protein
MELKRFYIHTYFNQIPTKCTVLATRREDASNDFVGTFEGLPNKDAILRVAKDGYGINKEDIGFVDLG